MSISPTRRARRPVAADAERMLGELASGELTLPIERYGLEGLAKAVERLRTGEAVGKVALDLS
ncbi:zinc-binding dehydrogenase [Streptomyces flaveus]|uniref:zinc-binding dehydrogenase n=1 Tax=Streptomyces flaveus TaxID=66370 RepID=UPI00332133CC